MGGSGSGGPQRTCVGCRTVESQANLVRVAFVGPRLVVDASRRVAGRGAYLHRRALCITNAGRGGIARSLRRQVTPDDVKRIVSEMSPADDNSSPFPSNHTEKVAGLAGVKTVETPPRNGVAEG